MILVPPPHTVHHSSEKFSGDKDFVVQETDGKLANEHYILEISPDQITLKSNSDAGFFYGQKTLGQILEQSGNDIPCLTISDWPDFEARGFLLDISRCQVPTLKTIFELIDTLGSLKINQLHLYSEHTFAYPGHELVWGDASPLHPQDIKAIDAYCKNNFIELVPHQNSFGHMEKWLQHPEYCFLAECPQGFIHPVTGKECSPSTLKPNGTSLAFLKKLYAELLPNFSSGLFHVGMDEPWELGQGWSRPMVESQGKNEVYLHFLNDVYNIVQSHKKGMLFWADIVMEKPELAHKIPTESIPVIFGYEADFVFNKHCETIAKQGNCFYVAAGTSTWRSFSGRLDNALVNIKNAARSGFRFRANGLMLNQLGDLGNHQPWAAVYPPLVQGASSAWNPAKSESLQVAEALNKVIFCDPTGNIGKALCKLGRIENNFSNKLVNSSFNHCFFFGDSEAVENALNKISPLEMGAQASQLDEIDHLASSAQLSTPDADLIKEDIHLATDMIRWANQRALSTLPSSDSPHLRASLKQLIGRYCEHWLRRNRPGGLLESSDYLRDML